MTEESEVTCPYCWQSIVLELDLSAGSSRYTEDCAVCCQPLTVRLTVARDGSYAVEVEREND